MQYTLGVQESLRTIFSAITVGGIKRDNEGIQQKKEVLRTSLPRFLSKFTDNVFQDEYAFLYEVFKSLKVNVFSLNQLDEIIERNRDVILNSPYIDMTRWAITADGRPTNDDEKLEAFRLNVMDLVEDLSNNVVSEQEFNSSVEIFIGYYIEQFMIETVQNMAIILGETGLLVKKTRGRKVLYKGIEDSKIYYRERLEIIENLNSEDRVEDVVIDESWLGEELEAEKVKDEDGILDFGLEEIDSVIGEMRRSNLITILGPPKGGKTRMTNYLVHRALEKGLNVCVWPLEGSKDEWISNQIACMIRVKEGISLDSKRILEKKYETETIRELVVAAKARLATDFRRGKLSFITGTAYCETFIDKLDNHYKNKNPFDIIVIDQLIDIMSLDRKPKVDRISQGYLALKDYITNKMNRCALALLPAQLKQTVVDYLRDHPEETIDITAGGESAETIRAADEVIGLFSSKEERATNRMKVYSVASRHSGNFDDFVARCELGCCFFESDPDLNI